MGTEDAIQYDLLTGLAEQESCFDSAELEKVEEFQALYREHNGLLLNAVIPELLQVSRTRWKQLRSQYDFQSFDFFGHIWFSRKQVEDFSRLDRSSGRGRPSLRKIIEASKEELL